MGHRFTRVSTRGWMLLVWLGLAVFVASGVWAADVRVPGPLGRFSVRAFTTQDGLPQNNIHALAMDQLGRLWVGTTEGAAYLDGAGWTSLDIPDEAASNFVTSILPASDGSVWIGRQDGGVSRYFKGEWTTHTVAKGFVHPRVNALAETTGSDGQPIIWAGTHGAGVARFEGGKWSVLDHRDGLPDDRIWRLHATREEDGSQVLWIGTEEGGVMRLEQGRLAPLPRLPQASVNSFLQARDAAGKRTLWAGTFGFGLARLDGDHWTRFTQKDGLPSDFITDLAEIQDPDGSTALWACTLRGLAVYRQGRWEVIDRRAGLPGNITHRLLVRKIPEGGTRMWVGTGGFGLFLLDLAGWRRVDTADGLPDSSVHSVHEVDGELHAGTALGLARFRKGRWETILKAERISAIESIGPPGNQSLWVGSLGGLHRLEGGRWSHYTQGSELPSTKIASLLKGHGPGGIPCLWVGTEGGGLARFDGRTWTRFGAAQGFTSNLVSGLLEVPLPGGGTGFWAATRGGGIYRFNPTEPVPKPPRAALGAPGDVPQGKRDKRSGSTRFELDAGERRPPPQPGGTSPGGRSAASGPLNDEPHRPAGPSLQSIPPDDVAAHGGFGTGSDGTWTRFGLEQGLPTLTVLSLSLVRHGEGLEIWAGTQGKGVVTLALDAPQPTWKQLLLEDLPKGSFDTVFGVLQLQSGEVILTGTRGVVRLQTQDSGRTKGSNSFRAHTYSIEDGLPSDFCTARSLLEDAAGRVVVGTVNGLAFLEPRIAAENRTPSPLRFRSVKASGLHLQDGIESQELDFSSRQTGISFDFSLITLTRWRETKYQTQLVGLEPTPTAWGSEHRREFTRLPPGSYQLLVWAKDYAGIHSGPLSLRFKVRPALWETGWFFGACGLVAVALLWVGIRTRERLLLAHNRELATLVAAQTGALQEANADLKKEVQERKSAERVKDDFTSMVSHELRTPLTAIRGALGLVASGALDNDPDTRKKMIEVSQRNSIRLLVLVNDLLDIQKIEAGMLSLQPEAIPLEKALLQTVQANQSFAESLGVTLDLVPCPPHIKIWADPLRLEQALTNLISNATKFSAKGGRVGIRTELHSHRVRIFIHNTGEPIADAFRPQIFQKFSQSDIGTTRAVKGTGLGLAITKAIIDGLGGRIDFESGPGGTTFWIELAQANEAGEALA